MKLNNATFHLYTLWLFIASDLKTMIVPNIVFAAFFAHHDGSMSPNKFVERLPKIIGWLITNLITFTINNQRREESILEDSINKPWRTLPSKRISRAQADDLSNLASLYAACSSVVFGGGLIESLLLLLFGHLYNNVGLGDKHWLLRNMLNAAGFCSFASGTLSTALQADVPVSIYPWLGLLAAVIVSTIHVQDMPDQRGDFAAGRKIFPVVYGDGPARWTTATMICMWSSWALFGVDGLLPARFVFCGLGCFIACRLLIRRCVASDQTSFLLYNMWIVSMYALSLPPHALSSCFRRALV